MNLKLTSVLAAALVAGSSVGAALATYNIEGATSADRDDATSTQAGITASAITFGSGLIGNFDGTESRAGGSNSIQFGSTDNAGLDGIRNINTENVHTFPPVNNPDGPGTLAGTRFGIVSTGSTDAYPGQTNTPESYNATELDTIIASGIANGEYLTFNLTSGSSFTATGLTFSHQETGVFTQSFYFARYSTDGGSNWSAGIATDNWYDMDGNGFAEITIPFNVAATSLDVELYYVGDNTSGNVFVDNINVIPEPGSLALVGIAALGLALGLLRRR